MYDIQTCTFTQQTPGEMETLKMHGQSHRVGKEGGGAQPACGHCGPGSGSSGGGSRTSHRGRSGRVADLKPTVLPKAEPAVGGRFTSTSDPTLSLKLTKESGAAESPWWLRCRLLTPPMAELKARPWGVALPQGPAPMGQWQRQAGRARPATRAKGWKEGRLRHCNRKRFPCLAARCHRPPSRWRSPRSHAQPGLSWTAKNPDM